MRTLITHEGGLVEEETLNEVTLTNLNIPLQIENGIYWVKKDEVFTITAECNLPDSKFSLIVEKLINAINVVDDTRFEVNIVDGTATVSCQFNICGNWLLTAKRNNEALSRPPLNAPFRINIPNIEFEVQP